MRSRQPSRYTPFGVASATPSRDPVVEVGDHPAGRTSAVDGGARSARSGPPTVGEPGERDLAPPEHVDPVACVLAWAVPGLAVSPTVADGPLPAERWRDLLNFVEANRVMGLLWRAIENGMPVTVPQRVVAASLAHDAAAAAVRLESIARWTVGLLADEGIDARVIKGLATAHAVHEVPELRDTGDIDLLVAPDQFARAREILVAQGLEIDVRWGPGAVHFMKEEVFTTPDGSEIDLHQSLSYGQRWRTMTSRLMADGLPLDGPEASDLRTLNVEALLVSAAISARGSDGRLSGLLDVAAISRDPRLDSGRLVELLATTGIGPLIAPVFDRAARWFVVDPAVVDLVRRARQGWAAEMACRLEGAENGARFLYSCLSGRPRTWGPGLSALLFPDEGHYRGDQRPTIGVRRIARQFVAVASPSAWR